MANEIGEEGGGGPKLIIKGWLQQELAPGLPALEKTRIADFVVQ
jgi:hypothetical protein